MDRKSLHILGFDMNSFINKKSISGLLVRLMIFILLSMFFIQLLFYISKNTSAIYMFEKSRWIKIKNNAGIEKVVLGNSHANNIYSVSDETIYFLVSGGEDMFETITKSKHAIKLNSNVSCLYINVSPLSSIYSNKSLNKQNRIKYYNINAHSPVLENDYKLYLSGQLRDLIRTDKWWAVFRKLFKFTENKETESNHRGRRVSGKFEVIDNQNVKDMASKRGDYHASIFELLTSQQQEAISKKLRVYSNDFIKYLDEIKWKGVVIFYSPPYLNEYYKSFPIKAINTTRDLFTSLSLKNDNVRFFDFTTKQIISDWQDQRFYFDDHMNINGAKKFTQYLNSRVQKEGINCSIN